MSDSRFDMRKNVLRGLCLAAGCAVGSAALATTQVRVTVESLAPQSGTLLTPVWVGFHDGSFDIFDVGATASAGLESLAEDGDASGIDGDFGAASGTSESGAVFGPGNPPVLHPGESGSTTFVLDGSMAASRYLSFAAMILPSNDAFVGNDDPSAYRIFDDSGNFIPGSFIIAGSSVYDAGTEVNDEVAANVPVLGQMAPNTGVDENGSIAAHPGFLDGGAILSEFAGADFTLPGYEIARITVSEVPLPAAAWLMLGGLAVLWRQSRRS